MSIQQSQASPAGPVAGAETMLASDADRDRAAGLLGAAFAEGRLTAHEHDQRLGAAYAARTWQQLRELTADLPGTPGAVRSRETVPGMLPEVDRCLLCLVLITCPPAGIAWWFLSRRRSSAHRDQAPRQEGEHAQDR